MIWQSSWTLPWSHPQPLHGVHHHCSPHQHVHLQDCLLELHSVHLLQHHPHHHLLRAVHPHWFLTFWPVTLSQRQLSCSTLLWPTASALSSWSWSWSLSCSAACFFLHQYRRRVKDKNAQCSVQWVLMVSSWSYISNSFHYEPLPRFAVHDWRNLTIQLSNRQQCTTGFGNPSVIIVLSVSNSSPLTASVSTDTSLVTLG